MKYFSSTDCSKYSATCSEVSSDHHSGSIKHFYIHKINLLNNFTIWLTTCSCLLLSFQKSSKVVVNINPEVYQEGDLLSPLGSCFSFTFFNKQTLETFSPQRFHRCLEHSFL